MQSTGDNNELRQHRTVQEGARFYIEQPQQQPAPVARSGNKLDQVRAFVLWVALFVQIFTAGYLVHSSHNRDIEAIRHDQATDKRLDQVATDAALKALGQKSQKEKSP